MTENDEGPVKPPVYPIIPKAMADAKLHEIHDFVDLVARKDTSGVVFEYLCVLLADCMYGRDMETRKMDATVHVEGVSSESVADDSFLKG